MGRVDIERGMLDPDDRSRSVGPGTLVGRVAVDMWSRLRLTGPPSGGWSRSCLGRIASTASEIPGRGCSRGSRWSTWACWMGADHGFLGLVAERVDDACRRVEAGRRRSARSTRPSTVCSSLSTWEDPGVAGRGRRGHQAWTWPAELLDVDHRPAGWPRWAWSKDEYATRGVERGHPASRPSWLRWSSWSDRSSRPISGGAWGWPRLPDAGGEESLREMTLVSGSLVIDGPGPRSPTWSASCAPTFLVNKARHQTHVTFSNMR